MSYFGKFSQRIVKKGKKKILPSPYSRIIGDKNNENDIRLFTLSNSGQWINTNEQIINNN